jgi:steroid delta-isomerase-like uncharacterized protein
MQIMADMNPVDLLKANLEAFGAGDIEAFKSTLAGDAVYNELGTQRSVEGRDAIAELTFGWREAFPDAHAIFNNVLETADGAVAELTWEGTQTGPMETPDGTIPASGNSISLPASVVATIEGGEIKETRQYFDMFSLLQQIGAFPEGSND